MNYLRKYNITILFLGSLILFTLGLSSQEVIGFDSRFYLFVHEMWRYGISWFPMTYHQHYPDYPATSTIVIYLFATLFGGINKLVAVLPTAILAAITVILTYLIGSLHNQRWGWYSVFFLLLTTTFIKSARSISLDMYPTVFTAGCFYLIYSADKFHQPRRVWWIYPLLFLGFAFRGPIGLVMPAGVMCMYYLLNQQFKHVWLHGTLALLMLCVCTLSLITLAYYLGGETLMHDVLRMEVLGRMDNHFLPRYFYFTNSLGSYALPYAIAWLVSAGAMYYVYVKRDPAPELTFILTLFAWMLVILLGMSIPDDKKVRYILPMLPAVALIAAYPFAADNSKKFFHYLRVVTRRFLLLLPLMLFAASMVMMIYNVKHGIRVEISYTSLSVFFLLMQTLNFLLCRLRRIETRETGIFLVAIVSIFIAHLAIIEPFQLHHDSARDMVRQVEKLRTKENARLAFYRESPDGLPIKYLINMTEYEQPIFIRDQQEISTFATPAFIVASKSYFDELPQEQKELWEIIESDTLAHVPVVVFKKKG